MANEGKSESTAARRLVEIPAGRNAASLETFRVKNALTGHPLFEPARIKRLLRALPRERIEIRDVQSVDANDGTYRRGPMLAEADPVDTFERLEEKPAWMLLHSTWKHDADYGRLLEDYVRDLRETLAGTGREVSDLGCWMFLSSGKCVVHFHADADQSFLNQVRGSKTVFVYPARLLGDAVVEKLLYTGDQGAVVYRPEYEPAMFPPVHLGPGESAFLPLFAPHRVINDEGLSISWNVGFHTRASRRRRTTHLVNLELRHLGFRPADFGRRPFLDSVKAFSHAAFRVKNRFFKFLRPPEVL